MGLFVEEIDPQSGTAIWDSRRRSPALHYGYRTPIVTLVSRLACGAIPGAFYQLAAR